MISKTVRRQAPNLMKRQILRLFCKEIKPLKDTEKEPTLGPIYDFLRNFKDGSYEPPFFEVPASHIKILKDPIDFYSALNSGITGSYNRICLSSLYIGTGIFEEHLVRQLEKNLERNPNLRFRMIIDEARGTRNTNLTNGYISSSVLINEIKASNVNRDIEVGLLSANTS